MISPISPLHLPFSPRSPLDLPYISPTSPLHLAPTSRISSAESVTENEMPSRMAISDICD